MKRRSRQRDAQRVLIVGGGVAGLETALALRDLAGERLEIQLRDPHGEFVYRPFAVGAPYGAARIARYGLRQLTERCGVSFHRDSVISVDGEGRRATTHDGEEISYDYLVVACGARLLWPLPGVVTFWGVDDEWAIADVVRRLRAGELHSVAFTLPGGCSWGLPVYELALFAATELAKSGRADARLTVITPEDGPLQVFGLRASGQMGGLLAERGIEVIAGAHPVEFDGSHLRIAPGGEVEADAAISLPRLEGRRISGIPHDPDGFVAVDEHSRVRGVERAFAAGDVTAFPVKQGGIATQQADAAAEELAAEAGIDVSPQPFDPILRGVLWTGEKPRYLYGKLSGGHGETSMLSEQPLWPVDDGKIVSRYLTPFLAAISDAGSDSAAGGGPSMQMRKGRTKAVEEHRHL